MHLGRLPAVLVVFLVVAHVGREEGEAAGEEVVGQESDEEAHAHGHGPEVAQVRATDTAEHLARHGGGRDGRLLRHLERVQLVRVVEEVGGDGRGVHGEHVDAVVAHLDRERGRELRDEGLGRAVHHREGVGDVARH